ncbi:Gfo/Idh/MocA family oxidoreductase [soil metagenome]
MDQPVTRAVVVGAGSIGSRHAAVLGQLGHEVAFVTARGDLDLPAFETVADALAGFTPEYMVIATDTAQHADSVASLVAAGYAGLLLVEKPLAVDAPALHPFERVGVGFNLRFHPVVRRLAELLEGTEVYTVEAHAGQHLAGWRPDRPVAEQYSAHASRGGGVLRDLSHELDYLAVLFGPCLGVFARGGRVAEVTVDSDDAWAIVAQHSAAPLLSLQLNYLDTAPRRRVLVNTSAGTIDADLIAGTITSSAGTETFEVDRDATYRDMHEAMLAGGTVATVADAIATDELIAMIETSQAEQRWVVSA